MTPIDPLQLRFVTVDEINAVISACEAAIYETGRKLDYKYPPTSDNAPLLLKIAILQEIHRFYFQTLFGRDDRNPTFH